MSEPDSDRTGGFAMTPAGTQLLAIVTAVAVGLLLIVATATMALTITLNGEVAALADQARKTQKVAKAMQDELAELRERVPPPAAAPAPSAAAAVEPRPGNIDSADPARDCVIGAGDKGAVARCMGLPETATTVR